MQTPRLSVQSNYSFGSDFDKASLLFGYQKEKSGDKQLTFREILSVPRSSCGLIAQFLNYFVISYNLPLLNTHFDAIGYSPEFIGFIITFASFSFIGSIFVLRCLNKCMKKRGILFFGLLIQSIGVLIAGIETSLETNLTTSYIIIGCVMFGMGSGLVTIPCMPEILDCIEMLY